MSTLVITFCRSVTMDVRNMFIICTSQFFYYFITFIMKKKKELAHSERRNKLTSKQK